jgi:hypothetical protein
MGHQVLGYFRYISGILIICDNNMFNICNILKYFNIGPKVMFTLEQKLCNSVTITMNTNSFQVGICVCVCVCVYTQ